MIEPGTGEEIPFEDWDEYEDVEPATAPVWRKPVLIVVAGLTAVAMALVPIYNVFWARTFADNGLEVCGFDYCVVQEAVRVAGLDLEMSRLSNTFLDDEGARSLADELTEYLDVDPIFLTVVDDLEGSLGGVYDPEARSIQIERPARAWTVLHEVAHAVEIGHDEDFQAVVIDLTVWLGN